MPSFHTYPEYEADVRAAFDELAADCGLQFALKGSMATYGNAHVELRLGVELQLPQVYVQLAGHPLLTGEMFLKAAGLAAPTLSPQGTSGRAIAQAHLNAWAQALAPLLPDVARGDLSRLRLASPEEAAYEQRLRTYVHNHAPVDHIARTQLWKPDWKRHAEAFLRESGGKLD